MGFSIVDPAIEDIALAHCRGSYQRGLVLGVEALSGSTLRGEAAKWGMRYRDSAEALLARLQSDPRLGVFEASFLHDHRIKRMLVVQTPAAARRMRRLIAAKETKAAKAAAAKAAARAAAKAAKAAKAAA